MATQNPVSDTLNNFVGVYKDEELINPTIFEG